MSILHTFAVARLPLIGLHLLSAAVQVALIFPWATPAWRQRLKRIWSHQLLRLLGIRVKFQGTATPDGLLVSNHISFIDIFVINTVLPSRFVSKDDVAGWPLIGWLSRLNGTLFIERGSSRAANRMLSMMRDALGTGDRVAIFPEGTSTTGDRVLPFHGALLQSAIDAAVPVHALLLTYSDAAGHHTTAPAYVDDISVLDCLIATLRSGGLTASLTLVASFRPPHSDRRQLAHQAHQAIAGGLRQCSMEFFANSEDGRDTSGMTRLP
jgi:1-acyl-sn-glycerol-3-phosphate acyltransferase